MAITREDLSTSRNSMTHAGRGLGEANHTRVRKHSQDQVGLEVFQRALFQRSDEAWRQLFEHFQGLVLTWVYTHPQGDLASRHHPPDSYVALAFERFWQATARNQSLTFATLEAALSYLKACLNGAILDTLRLYASPEVPFPESYQLHSMELVWEDPSAEQEIWEAMKPLIPSVCEQRLAYLLFHCGLKPREIVRFCPEMFPQVGEVYRLRRTIVERLLRHADLLRWRLGMKD